MGITSTAVTATLFGGAYFIRRKISRNWLDLRNPTYNSIAQQDLSGKTIIITGGNTGLGFETAKDLVNRNGNVILACRSVQRGEEAMHAIQRKGQGGTGKTSCEEVDLASLESVRKFIARIQSKHQSIDALILNAGVWVPMDQKQKTEDGYEIHFGINHLSHFLIARGLMDQLVNSGDGRIVFVSSSLLKSGQVDIDKRDFVYEGRHSGSATEEGEGYGDGNDDNDDEENEGKADNEQTLLKKKKQKKSFGPPTGYADTKLMNALTCRHMSTILPPSVTTYAVCPGFCRSGLARHVQFPLLQKMTVGPVMLLLQRSAWQGSQNILFATLQKKDKLENGAMYKDGEVDRELMDVIDGKGYDLPRRLWEFSESLVGDN